MNAPRPVKAVLADALAGGRTLTPNDWRLLAFYSWDTDEQQVLGKDEVAGDAARSSPPPARPTSRDGDAAAPEGAGRAPTRRRRRAPTPADAAGGARGCSPTPAGAREHDRRADQLRRRRSSRAAERRARRSAPSSLAAFDARAEAARGRRRRCRAPTACRR